jgi:mono/diheme cytochrome c family protein
METPEATSSKALPVVTGAVIGALAYISLNVWFGIPMIPTVKDLPTYPQPPSRAYVEWEQEEKRPKDLGAETYQVCAACHQAAGEGLAGTFPPLAGSEWVTKDPETTIRIVLLGLSGPIQVKGQAYNSLMPPPAGLDDEKVAAVVTHVRKSFGNTASPVDKAKVAEVRAALGGRTTPWTAEELSALRPQ